MLVFAGAANAMTGENSSTSTTPWIISDQADYAPGSTVHLTGGDWQPGEAVQIVTNDTIGNTWTETDNVTADDSGNIADDVVLPDTFISNYTVTATGTLSGTATTTFTDGTVQSASLAIRESTCTTGQSTFASGSTVCAHASVTVNGGGSTSYRVQWYAPGSNPTTATPIRDTLFTESASGTFTHDDKLSNVSTPGTWTVLLCKTGNAGPCSPGNQVSPTTFTVTGKQNQTITFAQPTSPQTYGTTFNVNPAATSGLAVIVSAEAGSVCTVTADATSGWDVTMTAGSGNCVLDANQSGSSSFNAAATVTRTVAAQPRPITVTAKTDTKVYDGGTSSNKTPDISGGIVGTDTANFSQAFASKDVGTSKTLIPSGSVDDGNTGNNYDVTFVTDTTGVITPAPLTVKGITANNKVWDGTPTATLNTGGASLVGVLGSPLDNVTLNTAGATGTFTSSAVGTWTVNISGLTLGGTDMGDYSLTMPTTTANITAWNAAGKGFYAPVGIANTIFTAAPAGPPTVFSSTANVWNTVKGGQTVPLKFNVFAGSVEKTGTDTFTNLATAFQAAKMTSCTNAADTDPVDYTIVATGSTTLRYDTTGGQWIYNWQTPKVSQTTCYRTYVTFADGSSLEAFFQLNK
ncbi:MAG TPA: PxKF domain-containing protein [Gaiellaceae bacterium]